MNLNAKQLDEGLKLLNTKAVTDLSGDSARRRGDK